MDELDDPLPPIWAHDEAARAMATTLGTVVEDACLHLLDVARCAVRREDVAAIFVDIGDADIDGAFGQLTLAGVTQANA